MLYVLFTILLRLIIYIFIKPPTWMIILLACVLFLITIRRLYQPISRNYERLDLLWLKQTLSWREHIRLVWFDLEPDENIGQCLRTIDNNLDIVSEQIDCIDITKRICYGDCKTVFLIIAGSEAESLLPIVHNDVHSIFIFCFNKNVYENLQSRFPKVKLITNEISTLINSIRQCYEALQRRYAYEYEQKSIRNLSRETASFIWFQLFRNVIRVLEKNDDSKRSMLARFREYYQDNTAQILKIDEFENMYDPEHILWWYSLPAHISDIINKALRALDIKALYDLRYCIIDLCQALYEARENRPVSFTVYRGVLLPKAVFENTCGSMEPGDLISHCGFLSTSTNRDVALQFGMNDEGREDLVEILYEIEIPPNLSNIVCADISRFSSIAGEEEILFDLDSTFEFISMTTVQGHTSERFNIFLRATDRGGELARKYTDESTREMHDLTEHILFGKLLADMGDSVQSELYLRLLERDQGSMMTREKLSIVITNIGRALAIRGVYDEAMIEYDRALSMQLEDPPLNLLIACNIVNKSIAKMSQGYFEEAYQFIQESLPTFIDFGEYMFLGVAFLNIGMMLHQQDQYEEALDLFENALEMMKESGLDDNHDLIAEVILNIGRAKQGMGQLTEAMSDFDKSLTIRKRFLPTNHFDIGRTYFYMGVNKSKQKQSDNALELLQQALPYYEKKSLGGHFDCIGVKEAIASVYVDLENYDLALQLYQECLSNCRHMHPDKHRHQSSILNNIGQVYSFQRNIPLAVKYLQQALEIHELTLRANHPDIASTCLNLSLIIKGNEFQGDLTSALNYARRAVDIRRTIMSTDNILLIQTEEYVRVLAKFEARKYFFGHMGPDPDNPSSAQVLS